MNRNITIGLSIIIIYVCPVSGQNKYPTVISEMASKSIISRLRLSEIETNNARKKHLLNGLIQDMFRYWVLSNSGEIPKSHEVDSAINHFGAMVKMNRLSNNIIKDSVEDPLGANGDFRRVKLFQELNFSDYSDYLSTVKAFTAFLNIEI